MTMQNLKRYEVAKLLNKDKQFVGRWVKAYKIFRVDGLNENRGGSNYHHLTKQEEEFVKDIVTNAQPAVLTGIGFTMSLFVDSLAFNDTEIYHYADKLAILLGSFLSGIIGYLICSTNLRIKIGNRIFSTI